MTKAEISTNDVFRDVLLITRLHKDTDYLIDLFDKGGWQNVTKSKIKSWKTRTGEYKREFRPMPEGALRAFLSALVEAEIIE